MAQILSPLPGTFYRKPAPDKPAFKSEGETVEVGLELRFDGVDQGARFTKLAWGKRWQLLEEIRQSPGFSSEERRARLFEQCGRRRRVDQLLAVSGERGD